MSTRPGSPLYVGINITTKCNLDCVYCYMQPLSKVEMPGPEFRRLVGELAEANVFLACIAGGEPFTHPSIVEFLDLATNTFPHTVVITNGTAFRRNHLQAIEQLSTRAGRLSVQVSIDSADPLINSRTRTRSSAILRNLSRLRDIGVRLTIAMVVTTQNVADVTRSISQLCEFTPYFHLMNVQAPWRAPAAVDGLEVAPETLAALWVEVSALAREKNLYISSPKTAVEAADVICPAPCAAGFSYLVIEPNLDVRPCDRVTDVILGSLREQGLSEIWNHSPILPILHGSPVPYCHRTTENLIPARLAPAHG